MPKDKLTDYDSTASNNTDVGGISVAEGMLPSGVNNAIREQMSHLADFAAGTSGVDVLKLQDDTDTNSIKLQAPSSVTTTTTFTLPDGDGSADQVLKTDGSGQLDWADRHANPSLIINGAMTIDQRNGGASGTGATVYTVDRWQYLPSQTLKFTWGQNLGSVTPPDSFTNYLGLSSSSSYSIGSSDYFVVWHKIEGYDTAQLGWGTASAKTVTLSFWVRSSLTGTFGGAFKNGARDRAYPFTYTISSADTWEQKSITVSGDTTGTWNTTNSTGILLSFGLGVGSTLSGTAGAWAAGDAFTATGATSVVGTSGATWYITGVKLEVGETATPFEHRSYGDELRKCQRYYYQTIDTLRYMSQGPVGSQAWEWIDLPVTMRAQPTATVYGSPNEADVGKAAQDGGDKETVYVYQSPSVLGILCTTSTSGQNLQFYKIKVDAEL